MLIVHFTKTKNRALYHVPLVAIADDMIYALSTENYKHSFTKNQVEQDLLLNVEFSDYLGYWKMIDQTESNGSIYYCFESKMIVLIHS